VPPVPWRFFASSRPRSPDVRRPAKNSSNIIYNII
jgi:hypothetical protein